MDAIGTLRLLEAIRFLGLEKTTKFYQASTSELYGLVRKQSKKKRHRFIRALHMRLPNFIHIGSVLIIEKHTGCTPAMAYCLTMRARAEETFVTRKITRGLSNIALGLESCLHMETLMH